MLCNCLYAGRAGDLSGQILKLRCRCFVVFCKGLFYFLLLWYCFALIDEISLRFFCNRTVTLQFNILVIDWGPLAQRLTFCQEQEQNSVNVASSTPVQPPGTLFHPTFMTLLIRVHSKDDSRMYFLIVLTTDYCWLSCTSRIEAPYKSRVDWLIDCRHNVFVFVSLISLFLSPRWRLSGEK